jgi:hypothetical protein
MSNLERQLNTTDAEIAEAKRALNHSCDGPVTAFVLIARATRYAAEHPEKEFAAANALSELLEGYGLLDGKKRTLLESSEMPGS